MRIAIPLYDRFTALDAIGPYEVLSRLPGAQVVFVAAARGPVAADTRMLSVVAEATLDELPDPEVLVVPGGFGTRALLAPDDPHVRWVQQAHATSTWTTSVCTGALVLAQAGLLDGLDACTHWSTRALLGELGAAPVAERYVVHRERRLATAAGVSAGIDLALALAAELAGEDVAQAIQLGIEYDPHPPFASGSLETAPAHVLELATRAEAAQDG